MGSGKYNVIYNSIRYLLSQKRDAEHVFSHNYAWIEVDLYNVLTYNVISGISRSEVRNLMQKIHLTEKRKTLQNINKYNHI